MEQVRSLLQQDIQTAAQKIVAARQEGQSEESVRQLYEQAKYYAELLRAFEQPAVSNHKGRSEQLVAEVQDDGAAALGRACREFKAEWQRLWSRPSTYAYSKYS